MSCGIIDSIHMEVLGQTPQFAQIDHLVMEVLGKFNFGIGSIDINHVLMEVIGSPPHFAQMDHVVIEAIGQYAGCPTCTGP